MALGKPEMSKTNLTTMAAASALVRETWPDSILIEAQGHPSSGFAVHAADIDKWLFVFHVCCVPNVITVLLPWKMGNFGTLQPYDQPWLEDVITPLPAKMSLDAALGLLRKAGFHKPFENVTLREPLTHPPQTEASYFVGFPGGLFVAVGALSGKVTPLQRQLAPVKRAPQP